MLDLLGMIEQYGTTSLMTVIAIYLFFYLNKERAELLRQLDQRTQDFLNSLNNINNRVDKVSDEVVEIKHLIENK